MRLRPTILTTTLTLLLAAALAITLPAANATVPPSAPVHAHAHDETAPPPTAPASVTAADADTPGAVIVAWQAVPEAAYYRIGWVASADVAAALADGREWLDAFAFTDAANRGQTRHRLTGLTPGAEYAFIVATLNARFGPANWSQWAYLTPTAASATPTPAPTPTPTPPPPSPEERAALEAFYRATNGDNWHENANWLTDAPLDQWYGVGIDDNGRVYSLFLGYNQLTGEMPSELGSLTNLHWLDLVGNQLTGAIPAELGSIPNLQFLHPQRPTS